MHIQFDSLKWKNFLSYGNKWTSVDFASGFRAIRGSNGAGKSTVIDALFYGLFGRTYRDVKIDELVNRINGSGMAVEVTFHRNGDEYTILRGRSPNVLTMTKNGCEVELQSSKTMVQSEIEDILGIGQDLFRRVVISSIGLTKPFMSMTAQEQRDFISDAFDLGVFTKMSADVKKKISELKVEQRVANGNESAAKGAYESAKRMLAAVMEKNEAIKTKKADEQVELQKKIEKAQDDILDFGAEVEILKRKMTELKDSMPESNDEEISRSKEKIVELKQTARRVLEEIGFFQNHDACPTCGQSIDAEFKKTKLESLNAEKSEIGTNGTAEQKRLAELQKVADERNSIKAATDDVRQKIRDFDYKLESARDRADTFKDQMKKLSESEEVDPSGCETECETAKKNWEDATGKVGEVSGVLDIQKKLSSILSDDGVRKYYVEKYAGVVNSLVNGHLTEFGMPLEFSFDGSMEAALALKGDPVSYMGCSEGEKKRIDVAILLAFMEVTKVLSNWDCNLVFFDELFDTSVDEDNLNAIMKTVRGLVAKNGQCAYVITHRSSQLADFDGYLSVTKTSRFSSLEVQSDAD